MALLHTTTTVIAILCHLPTLAWHGVITATDPWLAIMMTTILPVADVEKLGLVGNEAPDFIKEIRDRALNDPIFTDFFRKSYYYY